MAGGILAVSALFLSLAALAATFQCYVFFFVFFIDAKPPPKAQVTHRFNATVARLRRVRKRIRMR